MTKKQMNNAVLAANNGLHSARALATAHDILQNHDLRQPVLYHMILTGSELIADYQATVKALVRRLRSNGCRLEYFGAYEYQPLKGLHAHCFLVIETSKKTPFKIMSINDGGYLHTLADRNKIKRIHIAKPKNPMHGGQFFARPVGDEKLADCLKWCSYEFKQRSKYGVQRRETYFNSEFKANTVKRAAELAALVAPQAHPVAQEAPATEQPTTTNNEREDMNLTPAGHKYIAGLYETFVDKGFNLAQIRQALAENGIKRNLHQVEYDLDHRYSFTGYAASHPAPPALTYGELDALEEAKACKPARILHRRSAVNVLPGNVAA
jgi:hypothetical protein